MIIETNRKPIAPTPKKEIVTHTALVESWETPAQCMERVKKEFKITDDQLASGLVRINLLKN